MCLRSRRLSSRSGSASCKGSPWPSAQRWGKNKQHFTTISLFGQLVAWCCFSRGCRCCLMFEREVARAVIDAVLSWATVMCWPLRCIWNHLSCALPGQVRFDAGLWLMSCRAAAGTVFCAQPVVLKTKTAVPRECMHAACTFLVTTAAPAARIHTHIAGPGS